MTREGKMGSPTSVLRASLFFSCFLYTLPVQARYAWTQAPGPEQQAAERAQARDALNKGVKHYREGQYDDAIADFARAKQLDPGLINARLYLASAYASIYIPGAPSPENLSNGEKAVEEFKGLLALDPVNLNAIDGIGSILFQMAGTPFDPAKFEESKSYHVRHIRLQPDDPEPYYWVGVIDWTLAFKANTEIRAKFSQEHPDRAVLENDPLPAEARSAYAERYSLLIDEGIDHLKRALERKPDYDDAMAYLNLLYRRKADTVDSLAERERLLQAADELIEKIKQIKQKKIEPETETPESQPPR